MKNKIYLPHLIALATFFLIALLFSYPVIQGEVLSMSDIKNYQGQSKEIKDLKKQTGENALWTNSMFGGMPSFLIATPSPPKTTKVIHQILNLNHFRPVSFLFLYMLGFYVCLLCFRANPWLSIAGAIAYGFSSFFIIIIPAGHVSKVMAIGYMPMIIGGFYLAFQNKKLLGTIIFGVALSLQILVNHLQITYYTMIIVLIMGVSILINKIKQKEYPSLFLSSAMILVMVLLAVGTNIRTLWTTYEYGEYSTRGESELVVDEDNQTTGLDKDYATAWSYGVPETFTLLIPNFMGGPSYSPLPENSETFDFLTKIQGKQQAKRTIKQMPTYWGEQSFTSGPVYVGAVICFLFVLGLFLIDKKHRWWILLVTVLSILFSWGKHLPGFTSFIFDYLPGYNKFRAVSNALIILEFTMPLLAVLVLDKILKGETSKDEVLKGLKYSTGIVGGLILFIVVAAGGLFSFSAPQDDQYLAQGANDFIEALRTDRLMILRKDGWRSLLFVLLSASLVLLYLKNKLKKEYLIVGFVLLILVDMWPVGRRYMDEDNFESKRKAVVPFSATIADNAILKDNDPNYRVLNLSVDPFNEAATSYFHKSIGGYHGAKMQRYQELIEHVIYNEIQTLARNLQTGSPQGYMNAFANAPVLNMLNTKYLIYNKDAAPLLNNNALSNAWFVDKINWAENANEEIEALKTLNTEKEVVIDIRYKDYLNSFRPNPDSTASISLTEYLPNKFVYNSKSNIEQLAVFSEIYYPKGWHAYIDGTEVEYIRLNYLLRGLRIPEGDHKVEFVFKPQSYYTGGKIATASSIILLFVLLGALAFSFKDSVLPNKQKAQ